MKVSELIEKLKDLPQDSRVSGSIFYNTFFYSTAACDFIHLNDPIEIIDAEELKKYIHYSLWKSSTFEHFKGKGARIENYD